MTSWNQDIFNNTHFIVPITYTKKSSLNSKDTYTLSPTIKFYKKGTIAITTNRKESRQETIDDVYKKNITKYLTDSLAISNKTISHVDLLKSSEVNIWGFNWKGNIFKFSTANNDDFIYIEYILFDANMYYTIGFSYWENEKELLPYFEQFVKSINKIK
jgi:hypothetical protein